MTIRTGALVVLLAAGLLAGCTSAKATPTSLPATSTPSGTAAPPATAAPGTGTSVPVVSASVAFFLQVTSPADESTVRTATVEVRGKTTADAVVSVNGQVAQVDAEGNFTATVTLQQGPNAIDVVASDFQGRQQGAVINVIYVP